MNIVASQEDAKSENPYITDGLIAMWDGVWNVGIGMHSSSSTVWLDLVEGKTIEIYPENAEWGEDCLIGKNRVFTSAQISLAMGSEIAIPDFAQTVEVVLRTDNTEKQMLYQKGTWDSITKQHVFFSSGSIQFCRSTSGKSTGVHRTSLPYAFYVARTCEMDNSTIDVFLNGSVYSGSTYRGVSFGGAYGYLGSGSGSKSDNAFPFIGEICSMRFYSRPLSVEEIAYNYSIDRERFNLP